MKNENSKIISFEKGFFEFGLSNQLEKKKISINKLMNETETDYKVIKRLMTGDLKRIDTTVIYKLCNYFKCNSSEIFEYFPNKEEK